MYLKNIFFFPSRFVLISDILHPLHFTSQDSEQPFHRTADGASFDGKGVGEAGGKREKKKIKQKNKGQLVGFPATQ